MTRIGKLHLNVLPRYPRVRDGKVTVHEQWSRDDSGATTLVGRWVILNDGTRLSLPLDELPRENGVSGAAPLPVSSAAFSSCDKACDPYVAPDVDLVPALEASLARVRRDQHVANCECDYDCDNDGYFECQTDPRCKALREAR